MSLPGIAGGHYYNLIWGKIGPRRAQARANANPNMAIMLIGNKCDLERREADASDPKNL